MADEQENTAKFSISGKISFAIIGILIAALVSFGTLTANYLALEKRCSVLEVQQEKTCTSINQIYILNSRIEANLTHIKESLQDHTRNERGLK